MSENVNLANNILMYRIKHQLSQFEMAAECGISKETISLIEREQFNPTLETIQKCAAFTGLSVVQLVSDCNSILHKLDKRNNVYCVIEHSAFNDDIGGYTSYGVGLLHLHNSYVFISNVIYDICTDKEKMLKFVNVLNNNDVSSVHLHDVVDDFLYDR